MRRRARHIMRHIIGSGWFGLWALMLLLLVVGSVYTASTAHADPPSTGTMSVAVPAPSGDGKTVQGPVHANVSVVGSQATAGATYNLGWAKPADGCTGGFNALNTAPVTADSGGGFSATFVWPGEAGTPGALYLICASDTANPATDVITATQVFQVLSTTPPTITLQQAPVPTPIGTAATATPLKGFHASGPVQVTGKGFLPQGTQIDFFVTTSSRFSAQDFQPASALKTADGSAVVSNSQGQFTAIVILPDIPGKKFYLHAVSADAVTDGQTPFPPSLVATRAIDIGQPVPTPTPEVTATPDHNSGIGRAPKATSDDTMRVVAIAALGVLSLILFIIGSVLVASVALGPRTPPKFDSGMRSQPGAVRSDQHW